MASLQEVKAALKEPIADLAVLQDHLSTIINHIHSSSSSSSGTSTFEKGIASVQGLLLENVLPAWSAIVEEGKLKALLQECFAPLAEGTERRDPTRKVLATAYSAYQTLSSSLSSPTTSPHLYPIIIHLTSTLVDRYSLSDLWNYAFDPPRTSSIGESFIWEQAVKLVVALPTRVMNAYGRAREAGVQGISVEEVDRLNGRMYFDDVVRDLEGLMLEASQHATDSDITALAFAITKLIRTGLLLPPTPSLPTDPRPSFFTPIFPQILQHLNHDSNSAQRSTENANISAQRYKAGFFPRLLLELQESDIASLAWSFLLHLTHHTHSSAAPNRGIKQAAEYLELFLGPAVEPLINTKGKMGVRKTSEVYDAFVDTLLVRGKGREMGGEEAVEARCRVVVGWIARGGDGAIKDFVDRVMDAWTDLKSIKYSLFAWQLYITQLLLLAIAQLPPYHPYLQQLSMKPAFLASMQEYLSHSDGTIRRLGMLVAEILSELTVADGGPPPDAGRKGKGKQRADEVDELEKMLQNLGEDGDGIRQPQTGAEGKQRRRLLFGKEIWDGFGQGKEECRRLRALVHFRDIDAPVVGDADQADGEGRKANWRLLGWDSSDDRPTSPLPTNVSAPQDSARPRGRFPSPKPQSKKRPQRRPAPDSDDESLSGYSSSDNSSRSPSPTPSYLEEVARDPMSNTTTREKIQRPVYIIQLIELLRAREEPDKLEVGLKWGESLVRRKRHFGKELEENSIFLCQVLCALSDPYDLEEFEERRQSMLVALTACVPKRVAPYLIAQYFEGQYSLTQRAAILTALSMAARETAGFSTLQRPNIPKRVDFPSKVLPLALHNRYLTEQDVRGASHAGLLLQAGKENVVDLVLKKKDAEEPNNDAPRQRQLRAGAIPTRQFTSTNGLNTIAETADPPMIPFKDIAAEYFILPMINRFWTYFQDELARESRASSGGRGQAVGNGMILSPLAMTHYVSALTIMLYAARHSPVYLAVLAPEALDLAIAVGTQLAVSLADADGRSSTSPSELETNVVAASLELALVCLTGSKELDGGRSLVREHMTSVMAAAEWASGVFGKEQKGESTSLHKGGLDEDRMRRTAAGVVLTVNSIVEAVQGQLPLGLSQLMGRGR